jgi:lipoate-protein ligase A
MALDGGLLKTAEEVFARRYAWTPPALSLGKFQRVELLPRLPFDVVRRPSGGRAVLHGDDFEWSFAVVFPATALGDHPGVAADVTTPYRLVADAFSTTLEELGVILDGDSGDTGRPSPFCFAGVMRHDLATRGEKVVALAQARTRGRA